MELFTTFENIYVYIYYIHPELRLGIAVSVREREQGRFRGSREGARGSKGEHRGSTMRQCRGAAGMISSVSA